MKKLLAVFALLLGLGLSNVMASGFFTSASTGVAVSSYTADVTYVHLSTGYNNGTYLILVDSNSQAANGGTSYQDPLVNHGVGQFIIPPIPFLPSTATVTGTIQMVDLRDGDGGGRTFNDGLIGYIVGPNANSNKYTWSIGVKPTPRRTR